MYAAMYSGIVPVNINARYKEKELHYVMHDSGCKVLFTSSDSDEVTNFSNLISSVYDSPEGKPQNLSDVYIIGGSKDARFKGKYVVENVIPYYEPLIPAQKRDRHLYWTNFNLPNVLSRREQAAPRPKCGRAPSSGLRPRPRPRPCG